MKRVAITGIGIWSCLGNNTDEVEASLRSGRSGIGYDTERLHYGYHCPLTGIVATPDIKDILNRRQRNSMSEQAAYAFMASREAMTMAGVLSESGQCEQTMGCIFGNDTSAKAIVEAHEVMRKVGDSAAIGAGNIFQAMNSTVTMNLCKIFNLRGTSFTVSGACASGSHAIGIATMMIRQGMQDMILCGGAQEVNQYAMSSFDALGVFSGRSDNPTTASRPFDADRDGLVPSGGAAALVLEDYDHAVARGADIIAEVIGYGTSTGSDGRLSTPDNSAILQAMRHAISDAGISAADIDYINAHATSTPVGDAEEADAIAALFPQGGMPYVSSTKSMTGHECWMAGASEVVYSILMMRGNFIAPNINFRQPDSHSEKLRLATTTIDATLNTVLSNSFGFGGTNSSLIIRKSAKNIQKFV